MIIPTKKLINGFEMPVYGLGTWEMGGKSTRNLLNDDKADIQAIQDAIAAGITHIDTAEKYADGYTEELIGKAIQLHDRKKLFIVSKVFTDHMSYDALINACKNSIKRLKTSYLDLYLLHRFPEVPLAESIKAMNTLVNEGLVKHIGVSNFTVAHMQEAQSYSEHAVVVNQVHFNLLFRESEKKGVLQYCQDNDVMLIAWRPLQKGMLSNENKIIQKLCQKYHKTPTQIALNWLVSQKNVVTLSKTKSKMHLMENIGSIGWQMDEGDILMLRNDYPNQQMISDTVPLE